MENIGTYIGLGVLVVVAIGVALIFAGNLKRAAQYRADAAESARIAKSAQDEGKLRAKAAFASPPGPPSDAALAAAVAKPPATGDGNGHA